MSNKLSPPSPWQSMGELSSILDFFLLLAKYPKLKQVPHGKGEPVLVIPGFATDDSATWILRHYLTSIGYEALGWKMGVNQGQMKKLIPVVKDLIRIYYQFYERPIKVIGWSLGGFLAREAAREVPEWVDQVITLGTPLIGGPKYTVTANWYRLQGYDLDRLEAFIEERKVTPLTTPVTAIYSKNDGIVNWQACIDQSSSNTTYIESDCTHFSFCFHFEVFKTIAQQLHSRDY